MTSLFRTQLALVYIFGGIAKLNADWLRGEPLRSVIASRIQMGLLPAWAGGEAGTYFFAYGALLFDLLVIPALLWRRTWMAAVIAAAFLHGMNSHLFRIGVFPWFMLGATILRYPPPGFLWTTSFEPLPLPSRRMRWAIGLFFLFQCLIPFRHWLQPGEVAWNEAGTASPTNPCSNRASLYCVRP